MSEMDEDESRTIFEAAEKSLVGRGHEVINPWKIHHERPCNDWGDYILDDLQRIRECDAVYFLSNYRESNGAMTEYWFSKGIKIAMFFEESDIRFDKILCNKH